MGKSTFAERLNAIIQEQNIRQIDLCKKTGIGKSAMSQYLRGSFAPKQQKLYDLAEALNVSEAWLMGYDVPRERKIVTSSESDDADSFYFTIHDNRMRDAFIPSGAVVLVHKHPYRASAETPYESGQIVCFSYKDSPDQLRVLYLKDDSVVLVAASPDISAFPPVVCTKGDLSDGTLQIKGVASRIIINL